MTDPGVDARARRPLSPSEPLLEVISLALLGHLLSWVPFSLGFGIELLPALVLPYLALLVHGPRAGLFVAVVTLIPVVYRWDGLIGPLLILLEISAVAWIMARTRLGPGALVLLFWLVIGAPLWLLLNQWLVGVSTVTAATVIAKQLANDILAAATASLLAASWPRMRMQLRPAARRRVRSLRQIASNVLTICLLLPLTLFSIFLFQQSRTHLEEEVGFRLNHAMELALARLGPAESVTAQSDHEALARLPTLPNTTLKLLDAQGRVLWPSAQAGQTAVPAGVIVDQVYLHPALSDAPRLRVIDQELHGERTLIHHIPQFPERLLAITLDPVDLVVSMRHKQLSYFLLLAGLILLGSIAIYLILLAVQRETRPHVSAMLALDSRHSANRLKPPVVLETELLWRRVQALKKRIESSRKQLEQRSEQLIRMIDDAPLLMWSASAQNGRVENRFTSSSSNLIPGRDISRCSPEWLKRVHPDDREQTSRLLSQSLTKGRSTHEYRIRSDKGSILWVLELITRMDDGSGRQSGAELVGIIIDITHLKQAHTRRLRDARLITLGEMSTGIAHELNQPLQVIRLSAENAIAAMEAERGEADRMQDYLLDKFERIDEQAQRAADIIRSMRIFSHPESQCGSKLLTVRQLIDRCLFSFHQQLQNQDIRLSVRHAEQALAVRSPQLRLEQALINLIMNSRDAILKHRASSPEPAGPGTIDIEVEALDDGSCRIAAIRISDNGGGVEESLLDTIFDPFYTGKAGGQGPGLGLSLAWGLITEIDGTIEASNTARGLQISIMIPAEAIESDDEPTPDRRDMSSVHVKT